MTEWADAVRAVEQVQPAAVLVATSGADEARPVGCAGKRRLRACSPICR